MGKLSMQRTRVTTNNTNGTNEERGMAQTKLAYTREEGRILV
jgi:hypothetical protein